jgi:hypothetical protein
MRREQHALRKTRVLAARMHCDVHRRCVENNPRLGEHLEKRRRKAMCLGLVGEARADQHGVCFFRKFFEYSSGTDCEGACARFLERDHSRLRDSEGHRLRDTRARRYRDLARARSERRGGSEHGSTGYLPRARDDQHNAAVVLVTFLLQRQRPRAKRSVVDLHQVRLHCAL